MKNLFRIFFIYLFIFTGFYLTLFNTNIFSSQSVLFYRGLWLLATVTLIFISAVLFFYKKIGASLETLIAAILVSVSINLSFFVVFPVTFERSVTMFLLNTLKTSTDNSCHGLTKSQLEKKLIEDYIIKKKAVDKRINEQSVIDFIKDKNQCIELTPKAIKFLEFSKIVGKYFKIK